MKSKIIKLVLLFIIISSYSCAVDFYSVKWSEIEKMEQKGLPKSTGELVDQIYKKAESEKNTEQYIKALIYKFKQTQYVEDGSDEKIIKKLQEETEKAKFPAKDILYSMTAKRMWTYFNINRYKFYSRGNIAENNSGDIATWDLKNISKEIDRNFAKSLENRKELQKIKLEEFSNIINKGNVKRTGTTLYDLLVNEAIEFYENREAGLTDNVDDFNLDDEVYLSNAEKFIKMEIREPKEKTHKYLAVKYYQEWLEFSLNAKNKAEFEEIDFERINYIWNNSQNENKDKMYEEILLNKLAKSENSDWEANIGYALAMLYFGQSQNETKADEQKKLITKSYDIAKKYSLKSGLGANNCKALLELIEKRELMVQIEKVIVPDKEFTGEIKYKNISELKADIFEISNEEKEKMVNNSFDMWQKYFAAKKSIRSWNIKLPNGDDKISHNFEMKMDGLKPGNYILLVEANRNGKKITSMNIFGSSVISYIKRRDNNKTLDEYYILDRDSGKPLKDAEMIIWESRYNGNTGKYENIKKQDSIKSDENGYIKLPKTRKENGYLQLFEEINYKGNKLYGNNYNDYYAVNQNQQIERTILFTDKAIYRPGQTVYFKGIVFKQTGEDAAISTNQKVYVRFSDVNGQEIVHADVVTNEFGTFNGSFVVPKNVLTGQMSLITSSGNTYFSVEEYKKPKFEIIFNRIEKTFSVNEIVGVSGNVKAYAGYNIDNATVKYRVVRKPEFPIWLSWRYFHYPIKETVVTTGAVTTDKNGVFNIDFKAVPDKSIPTENEPVFNYVIYTDVTDSNGETQSSEERVKAGYKLFTLNTDLQQNYSTEKDLTIKIISTNINGGFEPAVGEINIFKIKDNNKLKKKKNAQLDYYIPKEDEEENIFSGEREKNVFSGNFDTKMSDIVKAEFTEKKEGLYIVELKSKDKNGNVVKYEKGIILYSEKGSKMAYTTTDWLNLLTPIAQPGEEASFIFGTSYNDVTAIYEIIAEGKVVKTELLKLSNEQRIFKVPVVEEYRGGFGIRVLFVKENRIYENNVVVDVPWDNKTAEIKVESFRDKVAPGSKETWKLKVTGKNGEKLMSEMVASMYDSSLDAFRKNSWDVNIYPKYYGGMEWESYGIFGNIAGIINGWDNLSFGIADRTYDKLNWFGLSEYGMQRKTRGMMPMMKGAQSDGKAWGIMREEAAVDKVGGYAVAAAPMEAKAIAAPIPPQTTQYRKNLAETAFFYPALRTNENGETEVNFEMPESLTKWRFMALAHTKDLRYGFMEKYITTEKEIMVIPNLPRFVREGDTIVLTAKIVNMTNNSMHAKAKLKIFDAVTMKSLDEEFGNRKNLISVDAEKGNSGTAQWRVNVPYGVESIICKISADNGNITDGEENAIPVVSARMLVTDTMPMIVRSNETKNYEFEKLTKEKDNNTKINYKYTLEFTENPSWYALLSLPYLAEYPYECSEQLFSRLYANAISFSVLNSDEKIKATFENWKNSKESNALTSKLEKNQELKNIALKETPWVLDAKTETERKQKLGLFFDVSNRNDEYQKAVAKLKENQYTTGGLPWFKGMEPDLYITQYIVSGFGKLININPQISNDTGEIIPKALEFIDAKNTEIYNKINHKENDNLGNLEINYLYAKSFFIKTNSTDRNSEAYNYYLNQGKKFWLNKSIYMQGMLALIMKRNGETETANDIMKSLKERAQMSDTEGMYWKDNNGGRYWYQSKIETQSMLIEAFNEVVNDTKSVEEMKIWLLRQKQTQNWGNTKATANAVYSLLKRGTSLIDNRNNVEVTLGNETIEKASTEKINKEAGTGYYKTTRNNKEIKKDLGKIAIKNNNSNSIAWGGAYYQYFENLDKVEETKSTGLSVNKTLYIEKNGDRGVVLEAITNNNKLNVGDKIKVRLEIRSEKDFEYVQLKDTRAAAFEPKEAFSGYRYQDGLGYYQAVGDTSVNFFFNYLRKGTYVFEYELFVTNNGIFSCGIAEIQSMYAPEFAAHSSGFKVSVGE